MFIDFTRNSNSLAFSSLAESIRTSDLRWGYTDSRQDEQDRGITVKASSMSLVLQDSKAHPTRDWCGLEVCNFGFMDYTLDEWVLWDIMSNFNIFYVVIVEL